MNRKIIPYVVIVSLILLYMGWRGIFSSETGTEEEFFTQGKIENGIYTSESIGWSMTIPKGWSLWPAISDKIADKAISRYNDAGVNVSDINSIEQLIGFKKDNYNYFRSFYEIYPNADEKHLMESMVVQRETMQDMFPPDFKVSDISAITQEYVDNRKFLSFSFNVSVPNTHSPITAIAYMGIIDNGYFSASMYSTSLVNKNILITTWLESKFEK